MWNGGIIGHWGVARWLGRYLRRFLWIDSFLWRWGRKKWWSSLNITKEEGVSMNNIWNSLSCSNMFFPWFLVLETKWVILWRGCWRTYKRSAIRPFYMTTWTFAVLWCMQEGLRRQGLREIIDMLRGKDHMIEVIQRKGLKYKTSLDLRRGFLVKSLSGFWNQEVIGFPTLNSRKEKVLIHQPRIQFVESVVKITMVIALRER